MYFIRKIVFPIILALIISILSACFGNDDNDAPKDWVRIDIPVDGFSTSDEYVIVEGDAALGDATYPPDAIYWYNEGASGVFPQQNICILACLAVFRGYVPLYIGTNTITVQLNDASATVTVIRQP